MDAENLAKKKKLQMEILMKESDVKRSERLRMEMEVAIRDIDHKAALMQAERASKLSKMKKLEETISQMQNEIIKMKHQMNSLGMHNF